MRTGGGLYEIAQRTFWLEQLRRGYAYGLFGSQAPVVGEVGLVQLINPAGSAVTVIARAIKATMGAAMEGRLNLYNTALTTLVATGTPLLNGGAAGVAQVRTASNAAILGTGIGSHQFAANATEVFLDDWIMELGAGEGVLVSGTSANVSVLASYLWVELP